MPPATIRYAKTLHDPLIVRLLRTLDRLDPEKLESLWNSASLGNETIEQRLMESGVADDHMIAQAYAKHYMLPVFDPPADLPPPIDPAVAKLIKPRVCYHNKIAPLAEDGDFLDVAVFAPESLLLSDEVRVLTGRHMRPLFAPISVIHRILGILYRDYDPDADAAPSDEDDLSNSGETEAAVTVATLGTSVPTDEELAASVVGMWMDETIPAKESSASEAFHPEPSPLETAPAQETKAATSLANEPRVISEKAADRRANRFLSEVLNGAVRCGATAVHLDIVDQVPRVRFRIRNKLVQQDAPSSTELYRAMVAQIRKLGNCDSITSDDEPVGVIRLRRSGVCINALVAFADAPGGENVVLRLRSAEAIPPELNRLGFAPQSLEELARELDQGRGMILFAGPRESGKTTTAYACLQYRSDSKLGLATIEQRVGRRLPGVLQYAIPGDDPKAWSDTLESCWDHDRDIVLVDAPSTSSVIERLSIAATSGQQILHVVDTTNAAQTLGQLRRLGIDDCLIADSVRAIVSQRLVRRLCKRCRREVRIEGELAARMRITAGESVFRARGCSECKGAGYLGRVAVIETRVLDDATRDAIRDGAATARVAQQLHRAQSNKLSPSLRERAIDLMLQGETSLDEVHRWLPLE